MKVWYVKAHFKVGERRTESKDLWQRKTHMTNSERKQLQVPYSELEMSKDEHQQRPQIHGQGVSRHSTLARQ